MKSIKEKLQNQLNKNDIKPHTLAKYAAVPESSIKNIIYGKSVRPRLELIESLAKHLNCTASDLLSDDDPRIKHKKGEESEVWNGNLYIEALQAVMDIAHNKKIQLTSNQANIYAERIYQYAMVNNEKTIDMKFANFIMN